MFLIDGIISLNEPIHHILQVEIVRSLEAQDEEYKKILGERLHPADESGLIQAYSKEFGNRLAS